MDRIYMDNSSTSFPKASGVAEAMMFFTTQVGCNIGRGGYDEAYHAAMVVYDTRVRLARLVGYPDPKNVIFTNNITTSMNFLIKGLLKPGDHVLVSSMEHNATMRPLVQMERYGVTFSRIPCDREGYLCLGEIEGMITPKTKAILLLHASNVCGTVLPIGEVGQLCRKKGLFCIVDAAQTLGVYPIDMQEMCIDALCFTGHKSLLGPQGIGGFVISDGLAAEVEPLISGGTGSKSDSEEVPDFLPDKFEAGTMNLPAVYGLHVALEYLEKEGIDQIRLREQQLAAKLQEGIAALPGVRIVGEPDPFKRCPIVAVDFMDHDNAEVGFALESNYGIMTRCGLHCAPSAHKSLGTFPQGVVRFSVGAATTIDQIDAVIKSIKCVLSQ